MFTVALVIPDLQPQVLGNEDINISIVKRELTTDDAVLFKALYWGHQPQSFSYLKDSDENDEDCYDDRLPVSIVIHKGNPCKQTTKELIDNIRYSGYSIDAKTASVVNEDELFAGGETSEEMITIQALKKKMIRSSIYQYLDKYNDVVYVVNGTAIDLI